MSSARLGASRWHYCEPCPRHQSQICRACSHRNRCGTPAPGSAPDSDGRPPGQRGPRQLESPTAASHHLPSEYRPAIPAEENSSLTTAGSRAVEVVPKISLELCNRLSVYPSRSLVRLHTFESFPDLPFGDLDRLRLVHGLLPFPVGPWPRLNNAAPSLQLHYKAFVATTGCSVPTLRVGTLALAVGAACGLSLHATNEKRAA